MVEPQGVIPSRHAAGGLEGPFAGGIGSGGADGLVVHIDTQHGPRRGAASKADIAGGIIIHHINAQPAARRAAIGAGDDGRQRRLQQAGGGFRRGEQSQGWRGGYVPGWAVPGWAGGYQQDHLLRPLGLCTVRATLLQAQRARAGQQGGVGQKDKGAMRVSLRLPQRLIAVQDCHPGMWLGLPGDHRIAIRADAGNVEARHAGGGGRIGRHCARRR